MESLFHYLYVYLYCRLTTFVLTKPKVTKIPAKVQTGKKKAVVRLLRLLTSKCSIIEQFFSVFAQRLSKMSIFALHAFKHVLTPPATPKSAGVSRRHLSPNALPESPSNGGR